MTAKSLQAIPCVVLRLDFALECSIQADGFRYGDPDVACGAAGSRPAIYSGKTGFTVIPLCSVRSEYSATASPSFNPSISVRVVFCNPSAIFFHST